MADEIKRSEFFEGGDQFFDPLTDGAKILAKALDDLNKTSKEFAKTAKQVALVSGETVEDQMKLSQALNDSNKARKASIKVEEESVKIKKQLDAATDEEVKAKLRLQQASQAQKQALKDEIALEDKQVGTLKRLQVENRQLRREREGLNLETTKGRKRLQEINSALDRNNAKIKANSDAMKKQRLTVGAYGKAVGRVTGMLKGFGATLLATFSIRAVTSFFKSSIEAFQLQEKSIAKVTQAIKSTGGAAGRTTEQLQKMASELQSNTLFGDEDILNNVTAQLLTFTNIAESQFDRTQRVALDLATVLDGDLKSASIQLGKALNDPIANLSALSRSGIQFSKEQKALIKTLTESGKLAEAQNVILTELERQYGGQAEAAAEADGGLTQLSNAFGDFKEKVGKSILEGLKPFIANLKEFFENISQDDVDKFIDKIGYFFKVIGNGIAIFTTYKLAVKAATGVNNLFGKSIISNTKSFGIWGAALAGAVVVAKEIYEKTIAIKDANDLLNDTMEKASELLQEEKDKLALVGEELFATKVASEERQEVIDKINAEYGTTLQNLEDEAAFANQVALAYAQIVKELDKKITAQVIEEELLTAKKELREFRREAEELSTIDLLTPGGLLSLNELNENIKAREGLIVKLKAELVELNRGETTGLGNIFGNIGGAKNFEEDAEKVSGGIKKVTKSLEDFKEVTQEDLWDLDSFFAELDNVDFDGKDWFVPEPYDFEAEANAIIAANDAIFAEEERRRKERMKALQETVNESLELFKTLTKGLETEIDARIRLRQEELAETDQEINRLKDLAAQGDVNAAKSLKAEEEKRARQKEEINDLERKKTNLLIVTTALGQVQQNLNSGDKNSFQNSLASVTEFFSKLPKFYDGSGRTIGEALGKTGTKDGHLIWADDNEFLHGAEESKQLSRAGFGSTSEIARAALDYKDISLGRSVKAASFSKAMTDRRIVSELQGVKDAVKNIRIVQQHIDLASMTEKIVDGNMVTTNKYIKRGFEI